MIPAAPHTFLIVVEPSLCGEAIMHRWPVVGWDQSGRPITYGSPHDFVVDLDGCITGVQFPCGNVFTEAFDTREPWELERFISQAACCLGVQLSEPETEEEIAARVEALQRFREGQR